MYEKGKGREEGESYEVSVKTQNKKSLRQKEPQGLQQISLLGRS